MKSCITFAVGSITRFMLTYNKIWDHWSTSFSVFVEDAPANGKPRLEDLCLKIEARKAWSLYKRFYSFSPPFLSKPCFFKACFESPNELKLSLLSWYSCKANPLLPALEQKKRLAVTFGICDFGSIKTHSNKRCNSSNKHIWPLGRMKIVGATSELCPSVSEGKRNEFSCALCNCP